MQVLPAARPDEVGPGVDELREQGHVGGKAVEVGPAHQRGQGVALAPALRPGVPDGGAEVDVERLAEADLTLDVAEQLVPRRGPGVGRHLLPLGVLVLPGIVAVRPAAERHAHQAGTLTEHDRVKVGHTAPTRLRCPATVAGTGSTSTTSTTYLRLGRHRGARTIPDVSPPTGR